MHIAYIHEWDLSIGNRFVETCNLLDALRSHFSRDVQAIWMGILFRNTK